MTGWRKRQVLNMALEALETAEIDGNCEYGATEIIRKALTQPERTWVGLTDDEVYEIYGSVQAEVDEHWERGGTTMRFPSTLYKAIEAKLKEKNFD